MNNSNFKDDTCSIMPISSPRTSTAATCSTGSISGPQQDIEGGPSAPCESTTMTPVEIDVDELAETYAAESSSKPSSSIKQSPSSSSSAPSSSSSFLHDDDAAIKSRAAALPPISISAASGTMPSSSHHEKQGKPYSNGDSGSVPSSDCYDGPGIPAHMANALVEGIQPMPDQRSSEKRHLDDNGLDLRAPGAHAVGGRPAYRSLRSSAPPTVPVSPPPPIEDEEMALSANVVMPEEAAMALSANVVVDGDDHHNNEASTVEPSDTCDTCCMMMEEDQRRRQSSLEVIEGKIMPPRRTKSSSSSSSDPSAKSSKGGVYLLMILFVASAAVLVVFLMMQHGADQEETLSSTSPPERVSSTTSAPTPASIIYPPFQEDLPADLIADMADPETSVAKANAWMWNDPHLSDYSKGRQRQRFAFVAFYYASDGPNWHNTDNWLDYEVSECQWYSSYDPLNNNAYPAIYNDERICDEDENLLVFDLHANNLRGLFPGLTHFYPKLRYFDVADNSLYGPPPLLASRLEDLEAFILSNNQMEGKLVADAGFVALKVRIVKLDSNDISAYLNPVYRVMPKLEVMNITNCQFDIPVATELQYTPNMMYLGYANNHIHGTLPPELGAALQNLKTFDLANNEGLTGTIPDEWSEMRELSFLDVSGTSLTGAVPPALCDLVGRQTDDAEDAILEVVANCSQIECCHL